jgi:hypothetical protein
MTLFRLIQGFRDHRQKGLINKGYNVLKTWANMPKKEVHIKSRKSLVEKGFITTLMDVNNGKYTFRLEKKVLEISLSELKREPQNLKKEPLSHSAHTEKEPHIKKYSFSSKKYFKKSLGDNQNSTYEKKKKQFLKENKKKIFKFLRENPKTKNLSKNEGLALVDNLIVDRFLSSTGIYETR